MEHGKSDWQRYSILTVGITSRIKKPADDDLTIFFRFHIDFMIDFDEKHVEFILEFRPVLFPINGFNDPFGRGIVPIR
jgi:hypothetical protein